MNNKHQRMRKSRRSDIAAIVMAVGAVGGFLYMSLKYPDWRAPSGFGPEWQCTERGARGGPDFCIKKQVLNPDQTSPRL
jgi:hypothetical protein